VKRTRRITVVLLAICMIAGSFFGVTSGQAADNSSKESGGVKVSLTTDKDSYKEGERIKVTVKIANDGDNDANNFKIGYQYSSSKFKKEVEKDFLKTIEDLESGKSKEYTLSLIPASGEVVEGTDATTLYIIVGAAIAVLLIIIILVAVLKKKKKAKALKNTVEVLAILLGAGGLIFASLQGMKSADAAEATMISPSISVPYGEGNAKLILKVSCVIGAKPVSLDSSDMKSASNVSVHDPSVVDGGDGSYYIFGSHMAWAKSTDLVNWTNFNNNFASTYKTALQKEIAWAAAGDSVYNPQGNMWAPDVIYNKALGKWCMYMSINGVSWNSSIAMLTADTVDGDWTYAGTVVYSGFTADGVHSYTNTDYQKATGESTLAARYIGGAKTYKDGSTTTAASTWNTNYGAHAIDPSVKYDDNGDLWMTYGSWSGGIYAIKLDPNTGLRDYNTKYELDNNYADGNGSDPYMGIKLAGGYFASGEASYVVKVGDYWYLFVTNGGLSSTGGYNMREFRAESLTGPYLDKKGNQALLTSGEDNINNNRGIRLMGGYKWSVMGKGELAQGHNSAFVDSNGNAYLVYHTRFDDGGEGHQVRVHSLYQTEDNWLVAAPFRTSADDEVSASGYDTADLAGDYEFIYHKLDIQYATREVVEPVSITLTEDGKVEGDYTGTWEMTSGTPYVTMTLKDSSGKEVVYTGVFAWNDYDGYSTKTMTFSIVGEDNITAWGAKRPEGK